MASDLLPIQLFVYGTLISGFNNNFLMDNCTFKGRASTVEKFALFVGEYPFVKSDEHETSIFGELYEVSTQESLKELDQLEDHPNWYVRSPCQVVLLEGGMAVEAQIYFNDNVSKENSEYVESGDFRRSVAAASHLKQVAV
jgi:gamma-glutamylaminecyclotransferase